MEPLPIDPDLPRIAAALSSAGCVVIEAAPGAGKTTRVPPSLLASISANLQVAVLEPRRIAARLAALRVSHELAQPPGGLVGYQVRFENTCGPNTRIRFLTEGVLARQLLADPSLRSVGVIVLDEFHERHLQGDTVLAMALALKRRARPDLGLVVMSATLDSAPIARYLGDCPIVRVQGRRFDVATDYLPSPDDRPLQVQVASALRRLVQEGLDGDVLVFLPGAAEIRKAREACEPVARTADLELVMLHGDMPGEEQDRAIARSIRHKVILSTNVAETSVTIEGVVAVIDSGLARVAGHAPWSGLPTLRVEPVSRASAAQRAGRAGRTRPGKCLRLYTRQAHDRRPEHETPEIRRLDLAETVLALAGMGVADPASFPWFEPPPSASLDAAGRLLRSLGALDPVGTLTALGRGMLRFPAHPRVARMLIEAERRGVAEEACIMAAVLSERDLELGRRADGGGSKKDDRRGDSDLVSNVDRFLEARDARFDPARLRSWGIDANAARAIARAAKQLASCTMQRTPPPKDRDQALRLAVLAAYPDRVARRIRGQDLTLVGGGSAILAESSEVKDAEFLVAIDAEDRGEGRNRRTTVRLASAIEPEWLLELFPEAIHDSVETRWNETLERVDVAERMSYLTLVLDETRGGKASAQATSDLLTTQALLRGAASFAAEGQLDRWLARLAFARSVAPPPGLPAIGSEELREVVAELCQGCSSFAELRKEGLLPTLQSRLDPAQRRQLESLAPDRIGLPSGRFLVIHYEQGKPPWAESRLQDFFGMTSSPAIAAGRLPLVLHLLAPNKRAVHVTSDLPGFWERTYGAVRKELCRKYPKHDWPLDGRTAKPPPPGKLRSG